MVTGPALGKFTGAIRECADSEVRGEFGHPSDGEVPRLWSGERNRRGGQALRKHAHGVARRFEPTGGDEWDRIVGAAKLPEQRLVEAGRRVDLIPFVVRREQVALIGLPILLNVI